MRLNPKRSPYFQEDGFSLYHADSLELLNELPENSIDMVFADPPYNLSNGGFTCYGGQRVSVDKGQWDRSNGLQQDFDFHTHWLNACYRVLKPEGTLWLSGSYHSIFTCGYALLQTGFKILNDICWFKPNGAPNLSCRYFTASHETLIWAIKDPKSKHTFNYEQMKYGEWHQKDAIKKENKQMRSVWSIGTARGEEKKQGKHPTQKPLALLRRIILASSQEGDVILDPFSGSGTTGIASQLCGRNYIGIEIDKKYLELTIQRYKYQQHMRLERQTTEQERIIYPASSTQSNPKHVKAKKSRKGRKNKSKSHRITPNQKLQSTPQDPQSIV